MPRKRAFKRKIKRGHKKIYRMKRMLTSETMSTVQSLEGFLTLNGVNPAGPTAASITDIYDYTAIIKAGNFGHTTYYASATGTIINPIYSFCLCPSARDLYDFSRFSSVYDRYKVKKVVLTVTPFANVHDGGTTSMVAGNNTSNGEWYITYDYDDVVPIATQQAFATREHIKRVSGLKAWSFSIKPRVNVALMDGTSAYDYAGQFQLKNQWMDLSVATTGTIQDLLFGFKFGYQPPIPISSTTGGNLKFKLELKFYLDFKDLINPLDVYPNNLDASGNPTIPPNEPDLGNITLGQQIPE